MLLFRSGNIPKFFKGTKIENGMTKIGYESKPDLYTELFLGKYVNISSPTKSINGKLSKIDGGKAIITPLQTITYQNGYPEYIIANRHVIIDLRDSGIVTEELTLSDLEKFCEYMNKPNIKYAEIKSENIISKIKSFLQKLNQKI